MLAFDGAVKLRPPVASEKDGRIIRCPILTPCVTQGSAIIEMFVILVALGVPTKNDCPYVMLDGNDVILGRVPLKRYGGE